MPPALVAITLLVVTGLAALNIYGHPAAMTRLVSIGLAIAGFVTALVWLRMYLVVDSAGIAVRRFKVESYIPWSDVARLEVVSGPKLFAGATAANTIRIVRTNDSYVDVPSSLLQPSKPTSKRQVDALLDQVAREIEAYRVR